MTDFPLTIALTGITGYAKAYLECIKETTPARTEFKAVTAINRSDEESTCAMLESKGVTVYSDFNEMIDAWNGKIDVCALPVPIHLHLPMTLKALDAGMNVILEKPMTGSVKDGKVLCDAVTESKRIAIGFQDMYRPSTHRIADDLRKGRIGKITGVTMLTLWPRSQSYYKRNNWAGQVEVNGQLVRDSPINNATAHFVNLSLFFAGAPAGKMSKAKNITAELFRARDIPSFDTAAIRIESDQGIPIHLFVTHSCEDAETAKVIVQGEKGSMTWVQGEFVDWEKDGVVEKEEVEDTDITRDLMWNSVLDSIVEGKEFLCTPEMAMSHVELVEALHLNSEIKNFSEEFLVHNRTEGDEMIHLPGLSDDLKRCVSEAALPSELGFAWARS